MRSPSNASITRLIIPVSTDKNCFTRDTTTTREIKFGKYEMVCTVFLKLFARISLSSSAKIIGAGKPIKIDFILRRRVFDSNDQK